MCEESIRGSENHGLGAMTCLIGDGFSHAPHQLKVLLAMMWWSHDAIKTSSSAGPKLRPDAISASDGRFIEACAHEGSSLKSTARAFGMDCRRARIAF